MAGGGGYSTRERAVIVAASLSMFIVQMDWFALNLMLPVVARDFATPTTDLQWLVSGYMLALGALMIVGGRLADVHGRRRLLLVGLLGFAAVSAFCGFARNAAWLTAGRVGQGAAAALVFPVAIAVVADAFPGRAQGRAMSTVLAFSAVGTALGPFVGGVFAQHVSWRAVFFLNVPLALVATALVLGFVHESRDPQATGRLDVQGALALCGGLVCLLLAVDQGRQWGWVSGPTIGLTGTGVALLGAFAAVERRSREPLVDLVLFRRAPFDVVTAAGSLSNVVYALIAVLSALYLQQYRGLSAMEAGTVFLALSGGSGAASYWAGRLARHWRAEALMAAGLLTTGCGLLLLTWVHALVLYTVLLAVCGLGVGLGWALTNVATQEHVPPARSAAASGVVLTSLVLVSAVGVAVAATLLEVVSGAASGAAADGPAIESILRATAGLAFLAAAALLTLRPGLRPAAETAATR